MFDRALITGDRPQLAVFAATTKGIRQLNYAKDLAAQYDATIPVGRRDAKYAKASALQFGMEHRADRLTVLVARSELAEMATDSVYRAQAGAATNTGRRGIIAGASAARSR